MIAASINKSFGFFLCECEKNGILSNFHIEGEKKRPFATTLPFLGGGWVSGCFFTDNRLCMHFAAFTKNNVWMHD